MRLNAPVSASNTMHAAVAVAVGHEQLVGLLVDERVGRLVARSSCRRCRRSCRARRSAAGTSRRLVNFSSMSSDRFVSDVRRRAAAADPDVVLVVDEHAVLAVGPVEPVRRVRPSARRNLPFGVELEQRRRRLRALRLGHRARPVQHPDVVVGDRRPPPGVCPSTQLFGSFGHAASTSNTGISARHSACAATRAADAPRPPQPPSPRRRARRHVLLITGH